MKTKPNQWISDYGSKDTLKGVFWLSAIVAMLVFFSKGMRWITSFLKGGPTEDQKEEMKQQSQTVNGLTNDVVFNQLPHNESYYMSIADKQEKAMQGWGTDWSAVLAGLQPLSAKELKAVYRKFSARINEDFENEVLDLFGWYNDEYSSFSIPCQVAYPKLVSIWSKTDLPLTFKK